MKYKYILSTLFYMSVVHYSLAQITPIETIVDQKKTSYNTQSYISYNTTFENQSYDLLQDLRKDLKLIDNVDLSFIKTCSENDSVLNNTKLALYITYIVNENGTVMACSLVNLGIRVAFSDTEIQCILNQAMTNTFSYSDIPDNVSTFYMKIMKRFDY